MEAEARAILAASLSGQRPPRGLGSFIRDRFADIGGVDLDVPPRDDAAGAVDVTA
jgi:plasmid stability protein